MQQGDEIGGNAGGKTEHRCEQVIVIENGGKPWRWCGVEWVLDADSVSLSLSLTAALDVIKHKM